VGAVREETHRPGTHPFQRKLESIQLLFSFLSKDNLPFAKGRMSRACPREREGGFFAILKIYNRYPSAVTASTGFASSFTSSGALL
jgi:hypothetical protein